ncbi:unnamed protein product [Gordionus sp. m RMFG-2023]
MPQELYSMWIQYPYPFGDFMCSFRALVSEMTTYSSILCITAFTVERYFAICHPFKPHILSNLQRVIKIIVGVWCIAIVNAIPYSLFTKINYVCDFEDKPISESAWCGVPFSMSQGKYIPLLLWSAFAFLVVPMAVLVVLYIKIGLKIKRSAHADIIIPVYKQNRNYPNIFKYNPRRSRRDKKSYTYNNSIISDISTSIDVTSNCNTAINYLTNEKGFDIIKTSNNNMDNEAMDDEKIPNITPVTPIKSYIMQFRKPLGKQNFPRLKDQKQKLKFGFKDLRPSDVKSNQNHEVIDSNIKRKGKKFTNWRQNFKSRLQVNHRRGNHIQKSSKRSKSFMLRFMNINQDIGNKLYNSHTCYENRSASNSNHKIDDEHLPASNISSESALTKNASEMDIESETPPTSNSSYYKSSQNENIMEFKPRQVNNNLFQPRNTKESCENHQVESGMNCNFNNSNGISVIKNHLSEICSSPALKMRQSNDVPKIKLSRVKSKDSKIPKRDSILKMSRKFIVYKRRPIILSSITKSYQKRNRSRTDAIKMLVAVVVTFFICWAPFNAQRLFFVFVKEWTPERKATLEKLYNITGCLFYANSTVNPILYNLLSKRFRNAFKNILCTSCHPKPKPLKTGLLTFHHKPIHRNNF